MTMPLSYRYYELSTVQKSFSSFAISDIPPGQRKPDEVAFQNADDHPSPESKFPYEISSGRLLTHYDETAGVAIPSSSIEQHRSMGHAIFPLVQSYRERYDQLRVMLTSKLLPRRELLLQLRRQLTHVSTGKPRTWDRSSSITTIANRII